MTKLIIKEKYPKFIYNMEKNEETFKQTFDVNFGENNQEIRLSSKKSKICKIIVLIVSLVVLLQQWLC